MAAERDRLFLLRSGFADPAYPERRFFCWECALIEGVLTGQPELAAGIDIERVAWERPRMGVIAVAGEASQSLPLLVLGSGAGLLSSKDAILAHLAKRYGFPEPHP